MSTHRSWIFGGSPDSDVVVNAPNVSRTHCRLTQVDERFFIDDLQSTNGTYVNGVRVTARREVSREDSILLGSNVPLPWPPEAQPPEKVKPPPLPKSETKPIAETLVGSRPDVLLKQVTIGRDADNDVVLDFPMVSGRHAVLRMDAGQAVLEDRGSTNGTAIGSPEAAITSHPLQPDDVVFFGSLRVPAGRLLSAQPTIGNQAQASFAISGNEVIFGRHPECDQVLDYPMISGRHARVFRAGGQLTVEDLGSANGTWVNGTQIHHPVPINIGDTIGLGSYTFKLTDAGRFEKRDFRGNVTIEARDVTIEVPAKRLIDRVSLTIYPSEFVGLMGPSGAGKTTLMNALNGYTPPTDGLVTFNGRNLYAHYARFASSLGYVPQDDIIHRDLTVGQALYFTARLRLPPDTTDQEIADRIARVLSQLGLEGTQDVLIGSPEKKGISGGQRKRVNLAQELLTDPSVLFLDEPTSGLSSEDALMVMKVLRQLADSGKAILLTIHQPSLEAYRLMDNLVLIGKDQNSPEPGRLVYYGPAYPDAVDFFNPEGVAGLRPGMEPSPDEILRGFSKQPAATWVEGYDNSKHRSEYVTQRAGEHPLHDADDVAEPAKPVGVSQWKTLTRRCFTIKLKDTVNTAMLLAQAPVVAILLVLVFGGDVGTEIDVEQGWTPDAAKDWTRVANASSITLFLMGLTALWFGCSNSVREIVAEWAVYHRERMVNLKLPSYLSSKLTVLGVLCVVQCFTLITIVHLGCGLHGGWFQYFFLLTLLSMVGVGLGLTLSAISKTAEMAITLLPIVLIPMVILGGAMQPVHRMNGIMKAIAFTAPLRWGFESLLLTEAAEREDGPPVLPQSTDFEYDELESEETEAGTESTAARHPDIAQSYFPETDRSSVLFGALMMTLTLTTLIGAVLLILRSRDVH